MSEPFLNVSASLTGRAWVDRLDERETRIAQAIAQRTGWSEILARILAGRGVGIDEAAEYLNPTLRGLMPDPSSMADMDKLVDRLVRAITDNEKVALFGDYTRFTGMSRFLVYRWFTDPSQRALYPPEDRDTRGRVFTVDLRAQYTADPTGTAGEIVEALLAASPEFAEVWRRHEVDVTHQHELKRYLHPELGELQMYSRWLVDPDEGQDLLVFTAPPGSPSEEKLRRLPR